MRAGGCGQRLSGPGTAAPRAGLSAAGSALCRLVCELWGQQGGSAPLSPASPPGAAHPAIAQHPAWPGCRQKAALPAKWFLGSGSIQKSSMTSSGHLSQRKSPKPDIPYEAWLYQILPLLKTSPRSIETKHRPPPTPQPAAGFGDAGTHRARCSDTGRACPGSAPACPSRPRPAP